ncbi:hypothetical protein Tco_0528325 [Tanacetum coccineum]
MDHLGKFDEKADDGFFLELLSNGLKYFTGIQHLKARMIENFCDNRDMSDSNVKEDTRSNSEFLANLNAEFHDRAPFTN